MDIARAMTRACSLLRFHAIKNEKTSTRPVGRCPAVSFGTVLKRIGGTVGRGLLGRVEPSSPNAA
jgi:hypothetical protein